MHATRFILVTLVVAVLVSDSSEASISEMSTGEGCFHDVGEVITVPLCISLVECASIELG